MPTEVRPCPQTHLCSVFTLLCYSHSSFVNLKANNVAAM